MADIWEQLPDNLLIDVFKHLNTAELCTVAKVCRRWQRVAADRYLWKHVDLSQYNLPLQQLKTLFRTRISHTLLSLQIKGYQTPQGFGKSLTSPAFFADLEKRCPNLRRLHLSNADLIAPLPASLEFLSLSESSLSPSCFQTSRFDAEVLTVVLPRLRDVELFDVKLRRGALAALPASVERLRVKDTRLPHSCFEGLSLSDDDESRLAEIDLSGSSRLERLEVYRVTRAWSQVTVFKMNECQTLSFDIAANLRQLEVLEANAVSFSDWSVSIICRNLCGTLRRLSISACPLSNFGASLIASQLTHLQSLDISACQQLSNIFFILFANLKKTLRFLNLSFTNVADESVDLLKLCMPDCEVVH